VKIYHKDREGCFLRFYQSWFEHNALYLTFEVAIESLEDCTKRHKRLKEVEAWDLLRDCSRSLSWLSKEHNASHMNIKPGNILKCQKKFKFADPFLDSSVLQSHLKRDGDNWEGWHYLAP
jgi:eukaryotic-like serine/threonine-protein kinase